MKLTFCNSAAKSCLILKERNPEDFEALKLMLGEILQHPEEGRGRPFRLHGAFEGCWQRYYTPTDILFYSVYGDEVEIVAIGNRVISEYPEGSLQTDYTDEEYASILKLMEGNRGHGNDPKVGIFWYNRATRDLFGVISHPVRDYSAANASEGRITCSEMHEDIWKKEFRKQKYHNDGQGPFIGTYQDKPRGRVFYRMDDGTFEVAVGKWYDEHPEILPRIIEEFDLPKDKTIVKYAIHWDIGQSWR